ncbi:MAG: DnaD domain protein [Lachnospiraceae bacterium]|nr:DnaD domain protein [Lachnospiraceae bacterium]
MGTIKLEGSSQTMATIVSNYFLDEYMPNANGEFVKIYLYLLRALSSPDMDISICHIADIFNHTEKDVVRALRYWEQIGLLDLKFDSNKMLTNIKMKPLITDYTTTDGSNIEISTFAAPKSQPVARIHNEMPDSHMCNNIATDNMNTDNMSPNGIPSDKASATLKSFNMAQPDFTKKVYTANEISSFNEKSEVVEFMYIAQKLLGKTLSASDVNTLLFFYDVLGFDSDLIVYLLEYAISNNHRQMRYIEKTAISWANEGIDTVDKAKASTELYSSRCYPVLKAFGISGRNPGAGEKALIVKWTDSYGFPMDIVLDACNRTMNAIHQPSFEYADSILTKWKEKGIRTLSDVKVLDGEHQKNKAAYKKNQTDNNETSAKPKNSFNNFNQRTYNYESLEKELLNNV